MYKINPKLFVWIYRKLWNAGLYRAAWKLERLLYTPKG